MNNSRDCWNCAKRAAGCVGMTGPRDLEPACWVPESKATEQAKHIECDPRLGWRWVEDLTPEGIELTGEAAERAHEAAERMHRGEMRVDFSELANGERCYRTIVQITEEELMRRAHAAEIELAKKRAPIIAVDFDGTLCENAWPGIGETKWGTVQALIAAQAAGARLILWTNRVGARLREAVEWCRQRELEFDAVNENLPEILAAFGTDCRKIYADIYLDDRAAQPSVSVLSALWETARDVINEAGKSDEGKDTDVPTKDGEEKHG